MQEFKIKVVVTVLSFIFFIDLYSWQAVKTILRNKGEKRIKSWKRIYFGVTILISTLFLAGFFFVGLELNVVYRTYTTAFIFIIYLSKCIACIFLFMDDVQRLFRWIYGITLKQHTNLHTNEKSGGISRAQFLSQAGILAGSVPFVILTRGIFKGAYDYQIHRIPLYLKNLPLAFEGLKVVQLSDIHTGSLYDKDSVQKGIQMIVQENADLVFFTGDLVNNQTNEAYDLMDHLGQIKAPMGVFSIFGNHDYGDYMRWPNVQAKALNLERLVKVHNDLGWNLMRNEHVMLERGGTRIGLIGVENWGDQGRFQKYGDLEKALDGIEDVPVKILLSHDPSHFDKVVLSKHPDIDITLSGHTHGFQFGIENSLIKWSPSQWLYPHWAGLYKEGHQQIYVNRGFGFLGYPGRVGILPEITVFELRRA